VSGSARSRILTAALWLILAACLAKLWLVQLPSSFWVDEMVTAFVVAHPGDPSFAVAPQVPQSIYYWLPETAVKLVGASEVVYRVPSILLMAIALFLIGRLAERLIHPGAAWFAVFACFGLRGINYHAADARPYALGIAISVAALCFLVRWLDRSNWLDALLFVLFASLLWRVHLIYWAFYFVFASYVVVRIVLHDTRVKWATAAAVFLLLGVTLLPVAISALEVQRNAASHVIAGIPDLRGFEHEIRWNLVVICAGAAWLTGRIVGWRPNAAQLSRTSLALIAAWWLAHPVILFLYSRLTGNSVFIGRYLSLALPGIALAATAGAASFIPAERWRMAALALGIGVLAIAGQWQTTWPRHDNSDWREAAREVNRLGGPGTPVIAPSPFIEGRAPAWKPDYPLPGFLYAHLPFYPLTGKIFLFPFDSQDGHDYARQVMSATLRSAPRFLIYGGDRNVNYWTQWFAAQPELAGWRNRIEKFGDVEVGVFER
jgi:hypothetical protein